MSASTFHLKWGKSKDWRREREHNSFYFQRCMSNFCETVIVFHHFIVDLLVAWYCVIQNCLWVIVTAPLRSIYSRVCCRWFGGSRSVWVRWCLQSADKVISGVEGYSAAFCHHEDYCTFQMCLHLLQIEPRLLTPCSSGRKKKVRKLSKGWNSSSHILCFVCRCILFISLSFSHDRDWRNVRHF